MAAADLSHAFGRTDRQSKVIAAFRNFAIAPKYRQLQKGMTSPQDY